MALFTNFGFETIGGSPGLAAGWTYTSFDSAFEFAEYGSPVEPWDDFESAWSNDTYAFTFTGSAAAYDTLQALVKSVENFEEYWSTNHAYVFGFTGAEATYDGTPENFEDFEEDWSTNESYVYTFSGTAASYDGTPENYEDFEEDWSTNQSYVYTFTGSAASYDSTPENYEDFEEDWPTVIMTTV